MRAQSEPEAAHALQNSRCCPHAPGPHPPHPRARSLRVSYLGSCSQQRKRWPRSIFTRMSFRHCLSSTARPALPPPAVRSPPAPQLPPGGFVVTAPDSARREGSASAAAFGWERDVTAALFDVTQPRKLQRKPVGTRAVGSSTPWCMQDRDGRGDVLSMPPLSLGGTSHCSSLSPPWGRKPKHVTDGSHLRKIQTDRNENTSAANVQCCQGLWGKAQHGGPVTAMPE